MDPHEALRKEPSRLIPQIALLVYIGECTVGCSGRWLTFGPLSIRMVLFLVCFFVTLPPLFRDIKRIAAHPQTVLTVLFGIDLVLCAIWGLSRGNSARFVWADLTGFLSLALVPGFLAVMHDRDAIRRAMHVVFAGALALSLATAGIHFLLAFAPPETASRISLWLNRSSLGGIALMNSGIHRIYLRSQIFIQVGLIYGVWLHFRLSGRKRIWLLLAEGMMLFALVITYTRGFWLGFAASAVLVLVLEHKRWKHLLAFAGGAIAVMAALVLLSTACYGKPAVVYEAVERVQPGLMVGMAEMDGEPGILEEPAPSEELPPQTLPEAPPESDMSLTDLNNQAALNLRAQTLAAMRQRTEQSPVIGSGLGTNLDGIRSDGKTEYMYLDLLMKTGVIGLLLFLAAYFGFVPVWLFRRWKHRARGETPDDSRNHILLAAYLGVALTSAFNPFLSNPMGAMLLTLTSTALLLPGENPNSNPVS